MLSRHAISDSDWVRIKHLLPVRIGEPDPVSKGNRRFVDTVLRMAQTGVPWRDSLERFGKWNTAGRRFDRWARKGVWVAVFEALPDPDVEWLVLDSTVIRAHPCAAGAKKRRTASEAKPIRSWAGAGTDLELKSTPQ